jgi:formate hydrogenlyase subunit 3/multisubunit Na+/H+ antiporter MnhD subunit
LSGYYENKYNIYSQLSIYVGCILAACIPLINLCIGYFNLNEKTHDIVLMIIGGSILSFQVFCFYYSHKMKMKQFNLETKEQILKAEMENKIIEKNLK